MKTRYKIVLLFIVLLSLADRLASQINLIPDPGFEILDSCPTGAGQIARTVHWNSLKNGGGGNPELFNFCAPTASNVSVPINITNGCYQQPHSGLGYAGIDVAFSSGSGREYIQNKLSESLQGGKTYCITFYANLPNPFQAYIQPLGAYLDSGNVYSPTFSGLITVSPQVYNMGSQLNDTLNWMKIQGSFVATGIENYITIGNFFDNANSNIGFFGTPSAWSSYYYIDDVSVIDVSTPAFAGNDTTVTPGDSVYIGRSSEVGLDEDCIWFVAGIPIDTVAGMWVTPTTSTTYVLQQTICGIVTYDSVTVTIDTGSGIYENKKKEFSIYPNPSTGDLFLKYDGEIMDSGTISIYDLRGMIVFSQPLKKENDSKISTNIKNGIYIVTLKDSNGFIGKPKKITIVK